MTPTPAPWDAALFDLDGTLADTVPLILASYRHTMKVHRNGVMADDLWLQHVGRPLRETIRDFTEDEEEAGAMLATYLGYQRQVHDAMVTPFPGAKTVVRTLEGQGVPLALVTSKAREMALRTLEVCGMADLFPVVVTADEVTRGKPHPEPVLLALSELGVTAGPGVIFVGDSPHDVEAGTAAGIRTVGVTWGGAFGEEHLRRAAPHHLIRAFVELLDLRP